MCVLRCGSGTVSRRPCLRISPSPIRAAAGGSWAPSNAPRPAMSVCCRAAGLGCRARTPCLDAGRGRRASSRPQSAGSFRWGRPGGRRLGRMAHRGCPHRAGAAAQRAWKRNPLAQKHSIDVAFFATALDDDEAQAAWEQTRRLNPLSLAGAWPTPGSPIRTACRRCSAAPPRRPSRCAGWQHPGHRTVGGRNIPATRRTHAPSRLCLVPTRHIQSIWPEGRTVPPAISFYTLTILSIPFTLRQSRRGRLLRRGETHAASSELPPVHSVVDDYGREEQRGRAGKQVTGAGRLPGRRRKDVAADVLRQGEAAAGCSSARVSASHAGEAGRLRAEVRHQGRRRRARCRRRRYGCDGRLFTLQDADWAGPLHRVRRAHHHVLGIGRHVVLHETAHTLDSA